MPHARNAGVEIGYEVEGAGPPLVLIHANPFDRRLWLYQVPQYAPAFRTIALDLRGYGESGKPETPFTLRDMADDVVAVCRRENVERAVFVGASVGANIALLIGLEYPELVKSLVLVGGGARGTAVFADRIAGYLSGDVAGYQDSHLRALVSPAFAASPLGDWLLQLFRDRAPALSGACIAQIFRALSASDVSARLHEVAVPTLVVNGELDLALPLSRELVVGIPGARHVVIPGTGHACNLEEPQTFDRVTTPFLLAHGA
jgi:pimeloyl-ACP methyl ester carboxylesterase